MKKYLLIPLLALSVMSVSAFSIKEAIKTFISCEIGYLAYTTAVKYHVIDPHIPSVSVTVDGKTHVIFKGRET